MGLVVVVGDVGQVFPGNAEGVRVVVVPGGEDEVAGAARAGRASARKARCPTLAKITSRNC